MIIIIRNLCLIKILRKCILVVMAQTYQKLIKKFSQEANKLGKEKEAIKLLILELSGLNGAEFVEKLHDELSEEEVLNITNAVNEYLIKNRPIQHILGYAYFYGYKMIVNENVLIPRYETEELVGYVLNKYDEVFDGKKVMVVDVGTGSGNIALALAKEEPNMTLYATDISDSALEVAKENAKNNDAKITFYQGDMLNPLIERNLKFDILVSNPPYIPDSEFVEDIVRDNEPHIALFGGTDGMKFYEIILRNAHKILNKPAIIAFEHSYNKKMEMEALVKHYFNDAEVEVIKDLQGKDRMTLVVIK